MKKIVAISDTHCHSLPSILEGVSGDLLLIAGDWSYQATWVEIGMFKADLKAIRDQFTDIVVISGNHEVGIEENPHLEQEIAKDCNVIYLNNSEATVQGLRIYGSPDTPWFGGWAFNFNRGEELKRRWENIPEGLDILLLHGPAYGVCDLIPWTEERVGCKDLLNKLQSLENPPKIVISGHIHSAYTNGKGIRRTIGESILTFYNVSICNEQYNASNQPTEIFI